MNRGWSLQQMVLVKLYNHKRKKETEPSHTIHKNQLKMH